MNTNSKEELLKRLAKGDVMRDWGAIVALGRSQINRMLEQQFLASFNALSFLMPFSGTFVTDDTNEVRVTLSDLVLGVPRLSFEKTSLDDSKVSVSMNIMAGNVDTMLYLPGSPPRVLKTVPIRQSMGYQMQMTARLTTRFEWAVQRGRVLLDLSESSAFTCNLGSTAADNLAYGMEIGTRIKAHPIYRQLFTVAMLDFTEYGALGAEFFEMLTQPHPESAKAGVHGGDGAVVLFCKLRANKDVGKLPIGASDFPYLIPDDLTARGEPQFNATVLLDEKLASFTRDGESPFIRQLKLPNAHQLDVGETHKPRDHVSFGAINPSSRTFMVDPQQSDVVAGASRSFALKNNGVVLNAPSSWSAVGLNSSNSTGQITAEGTYTALSSRNFKRRQQAVVISNQYTDAGKSQARVGLLMEFSQALEIAPRINTWSKGKPPIDLIASGASAMTWSLIGENYGVLKDLGGGLAQFTPHDPEHNVPEILLQRIRVTDPATQNHAEATVVIIAFADDLTLDPPLARTGGSTEPIEFTVVQTREPGEESQPRYAPQASASDTGVPGIVQDPALTWQVFGEGTATEKDEKTGVFYPPEKPASEVSVVMADLNGRSVGYATVDLVQGEGDPDKWEKLNKFDLQVRGNPECFANGMQQIEVLITIETAQLSSGNYVPLSPDELSTLKFYDLVSHAELGFIEADQEGIPPGNTPWMVNTIKNRFTAYGGGAREGGVVQAEEATVRRLLYLQSAKESAGTEVYAKFKRDDGIEFSSGEFSQKIAVSSKKTPSVDIEYYTFEPERVWNGRGELVGDDDFDYRLESTDYWRLTYKQNGLYAKKFYTCQPQANISLVRWESEQLDETFFSYLGIAFNPMPYEGSVPPTEVSLDQWLLQLFKKQAYKTFKKEFEKNKQPAPGELMVSLNRTDDMPYWHDSMATGEEDELFREHLEDAIFLVLRDEDGNEHRLSIDFPPATTADSRNVLKLSVF